MIHSIQHLKNKLGAGFILEMNMQSDEKQVPVKEYVKKLLPNTDENERFCKYVYIVPSLGCVFEKIEAGTIVQRALPLMWDLYSSRRECSFVIMMAL